MKVKTFGILTLPLLFMFFTAGVLAADDDGPVPLESRDQAITKYQNELEAIGMDSDKAEEKAGKDVDALIAGMNSSQSDVAYSYDALDERVDQLLTNDGRRGAAEKALKAAKNSKDDFTSLSPDKQLELMPAIAGALPQLLPGTDFVLAEEEAH